MFTLSMLFLCSLVNIYVSDFHIAIISCFWIFTFFHFLISVCSQFIIVTFVSFHFFIFKFSDFHIFTFSHVYIFTCLNFPILHAQTVCNKNFEIYKDIYTHFKYNNTNIYKGRKINCEA